MNPTIITAPEGGKNVPKCTSCFNPASCVWMDEWGTVPLCNDCATRREAAYRKWVQYQDERENGTNADQGTKTDSLTQYEDGWR